MATPSKKKSDSSETRNPDRRNGKAWKKNPQKPKVRTPERQEKDFMIRFERTRRRIENQERRAAEKAAAEALRLLKEAEETARKEAELKELELAKEHSVKGLATRIKRKKRSTPKPREKDDFVLSREDFLGFMAALD